MISKAETILRNLQAVSIELLSLGFRFHVMYARQAALQSSDWALELRLSQAMRHARKSLKTPLRDPVAILAEPALRWIEEERIVLPHRFAPHPQTLRTIVLDPEAGAKMQAFESESGVKLADSIRIWFSLCGSVDLRGTHPFLNPGGRHAALRIRSFDRCAKNFAPPWLPLCPQEGDEASFQVDAESGLLSDGRDLLDAIEHALWWAGIPALAGTPDPPMREIEFIRARMGAPA